MEGLRNGKKFGIVAGSDTHTARPGGSVQDVRPYGGGLCGVWAEELTKRSLFDAFVSRRTYAIGSERVVFLFSVNGCIMGGIISRSEMYLVHVKVWSPIKVDKLQVLLNGKLLHKETINNDVLDFRYYIENSSLKGSDFIHCRLVLENGEATVCSPVWVD